MTYSSLTVKLPIVVFVSVMTVLAGHTAFLFADQRTSLTKQAAAAIEGATYRAANRVDQWISQTEASLKMQAKSQNVKDSLHQFGLLFQAMGENAETYLQTTYVQGNPYSGAARDDFVNPMDRTAYSITHAKLHDHFRILRRDKGLEDVYLFDSLGNVIYSVAKESDLGQSALSGRLSETGLAKAYARALSAPADSVAFEDFAPYALVGNALSSFIAISITDDQGKRTGVIAFRLSPAPLATVLRGDERDASTYEISMIGADGAFRVADRTHSPGQMAPPSPQIEAATSGQTGLMIDAIHNTAEPVIAAFHPVTALATGWSVITLAGRDTMLASVGTTIQNFIFTMAIGGLLIACLGLLLGRWIARPISQLSLGMRAIAQGEQVEILHRSRKDELGDIARGIEQFRMDQEAATLGRMEMLFKGKAFNRTATAMMIADTEGKLLFVNDAAFAMFRQNLDAFRERFAGFDPETLIGTNISIFHRDHSRNMTMLQDPANRQMEADIAIGAEIFALQISAVEEDGAGRIGYVVSWEAVREQRRTSSIIAGIDATQVIVEITPDGIIHDMNAFGQKLYEYDGHPEALIGQPLSILFAEGDAAANGVLQRVLAQGSLVELHHRKTRTGKEMWVLCNLKGIRNRAGKIVSIVGICTDQTEAVLTRNHQQQTAREQAAEQQGVVDALGKALAGLSQGDMTARITATFPHQYQLLKDNYNEALGNLNATLRQVARVSDTILSGANVIADSASELSQRTESQAATLEETAAALDVLTNNVRTTTSGTNSAGSMVTAAHDEAHKNATIVRQAIDAMMAIEASSQQISTIISVIDDIAFQTNLLALNAGVEAARAGDAGRGFAVVAAEVRALAQRSSVAASEIKDLISQSERQVASGATIVSKSGEVISAIVADMAEINSIVAAIAQSTQEQSSGLTEINSGMTLLDRVTQQNAAMVDQSTAQGTQLKTEATALSDLLRGFNLSVDAGHALRVNAA